jgi:aminopeptidase N
MRLLLVLLLAMPSAALAAPLQPEGRGVAAQDRRVDLQHLALDVAVDVGAGTVEGTATLTVRPLRRGLKEVVLHQVALDVQRVTVDGVETTFALEPNTLRIALPSPAELDTALVIATTYRAAPTNGLHFRRAPPNGHDGHDEAWTQGEATDNRHWFPGWDEPNDRFTLSTTISAPDRFLAVANGTLRSRAPDPARPGWTRWSWALGGGDVETYQVMLAVGAYERGETSWRGRPVMWFTPPGTDPAIAAHTVGRTVPMLDYFSELTGVEYPYDAYNQVFVQRFLYTGMENTSATVLDARLLHPAAYAASRSNSDSVIAHELAHQWYGDQLTCRTWREMWLNEGFATFIGGMWNEHADGPFEGASAVLRRYAGERKADERIARPLVVDFTNAGADARGSNPYGKGASVLQMLRVMLDEEAFWRGIRRYTADHQHGSVETDDLRRALEDESGLALGWFFDQWVRSAGHPKLSVTAAVDAEAGAVRIGLKQTQSAEWPTFTLPVDVEVATTAGTAVHRLWMDARDGGALIPIEGELLYVAADPKGGLLAEIDLKQGPAAWRLLLEQSPHPYARLWALDHLDDLAPDDALRATVQGLLSGRTNDRILRAAAGDLLADWGADSDVAALLAALQGEPDSGLRERIVEDLGRTVPGPATVSALASLLRDDPVPDVRAAAITALGTLEGEDVRRRLFLALRAGSGVLQLVERAAAGVLGARGRVGDIDALSALRGPSTNHRTRMAAWAATVELVQRAPVADRDALRRPLAREADRMLEDLNLRARQQAIQLLRTLGDDRSVAALQAQRAREDIESVRESIDATIEAIRARRDTEPDPNDAALQAKLKALEDRLDRTEHDLKALLDRP